MPTVLDMVKRSMRLMGTLPVDRAPTTQEGADGLSALQSMMDAWGGTERGMVYHERQDSYSWPSGAVSRTIGSGGDFNATRPSKVVEEGNFFRDNGLDYGLVVLGDRDAYDGITQKTSQSTYPGYLFADTGYPLMTLYVWPVPTLALTLFLNTWKALQSFTSLTDVLAMPAGYQAAIEHNLAIWYAPEFGSAAVARAATLEKRAALLKANIKSVNQPDLVATLDLAIAGGRPYNIFTDV